MKTEDLKKAVELNTKLKELDCKINDIKNIGSYNLIGFAEDIILEDDEHKLVKATLLQRLSEKRDAILKEIEKL